MNGVDLILVLIILFSVWMGWRRGAVAGFRELIGWIGSLFIGYWFYKPVSAWLVQHFPSMGVWANPFGFLMLVIVSRMALSIILSRILPYQHADEISLPDKVFGIIPGLVNGAINAAIVAAILLFLPIAPSINNTAKSSGLATVLGNQVQQVDDALMPIFDPVIKKVAQPKAVYPDANSTTKLGFTVTNAAPRAELEKEMFELVNKERAAQGLQPLVWDADLLPAARNHSKDMFARGYFSHYSLEGKTVADRLRESKVRFVMAGENLALAQSIPLAHEGLMNSPGHRANILHKSYGRIAIGVLDGGAHGLMITQVFKN